MPSMGVGTDDREGVRPVHGDALRVVRSRRSPRLTTSEAVVVLQRWFHRQWQGLQARRLRALLALWHDHPARVDEVSSTASSVRAPSVPEELACVLDAVEAYTAALDTENYTRYLVCEESLPASSAVWRTASPSARRRLRQQHPRLRRVSVPPDPIRRSIADGLAAQLDGIIADGDTEASVSWSEVDVRLTRLVGAELSEWLSTVVRAQRARSSPVATGAVTTDEVTQVLATWARWRTGGRREPLVDGHNTGRADRSCVPSVETMALAQDVPPLPSPRVVITHMDPTQTDSASRTGDGPTGPPVPLSMPLADRQPPHSSDADLDVDAWLREEDKDNDGVADVDEAAVNRANARFHAAQADRCAAVRASLVQRLGVHVKDVAHVATTADGSGTESSLPRNDDVADVVVPFLGSGSPPPISSVCAVCELEGVWPEAAGGDTEDELVRCTGCQMTMHRMCTKAGSREAPVCSSWCATRTSRTHEHA